MLRAVELGPGIMLAKVVCMKHSSISDCFFKVPVAKFFYHLLCRHRNPRAFFSKDDEVYPG
jgi:hypothetical protein